MAYEGVDGDSDLVALGAPWPALSRLQRSNIIPPLTARQIRAGSSPCQASHVFIHALDQYLPFAMLPSDEINYAGRLMDSPKHGCTRVGSVTC